MGNSLIPSVVNFQIILKLSFTYCLSSNNLKHVLILCVYDYKRLKKSTKHLC